ncbi:MAG: M13 family metallopeptidase [Thermoplasmata archaeon]
MTETPHRQGTSLPASEAAPTSGSEESLRFSVTHLDQSVRPQEDIYTFAAGGWIARHPIPPDRSSWSSFQALAEANLRRLHALLVEAEAAARANPFSVRPTVRQVGEFFASVMDQATVEARGIEPLKGEFSRLGPGPGPAELPQLFGRWHNLGISAAFSAYVDVDRQDSSCYAPYLEQGGLSLPDREYYLADSFAEIRTSFLRHLERNLVLLGVAPAEAQGDSAAILDLETELARASRSRTELRDEVKNYHRRRLEELERDYPNLRWPDYLKARGGMVPEYVVVGQPEFYERLDQLVRDRPPETWIVYLRWHLLRAAAPWLSSVFETENFEFYHRILQGQPEPEPRWKRATELIDGCLGEALGELYVERHFPPEARRRMEALVADLRAVFRDRLSRVPWMSPETREKALAKFDRFRVKIGHPERFRDYSSIRIDRADLWGNVARARAFEVARRWQRMGQAVDRTEWEMTPPQVNAYFHPSLNEIVFPAGILQPPFFDVDQDDAVNYGAIGAVIGHEITHGYDDQGRKYDAQGNLKDWWQPADQAEFEARAQRSVRQYGGYEALPGARVNGELTLGENIADLGGVSIALEAFRRSRGTSAAAVQPIDGFTPEQRFFLSYAQLWRGAYREPALRLRLTIDPHSPVRFRAIGPLSNLEEFYRAFDVRPGDPLWRAPEERVEIW